MRLLAALASCSSACSERSTATTAAPSATNCRTIAEPIPPPAPVTSATFPCSRLAIFQFSGFLRENLSARCAQRRGIWNARAAECKFRGVKRLSEENSRVRAPAKIRAGLARALTRLQRAQHAAAGLLLAFGWASPAAAHGFGQRYDLPLPLSFYVWGAAATVTLSFLGFAFFLPRETDHAWRVELPLGETLVRGVGLVARTLPVMLFALAIAAGFTGTPDPARNIAPVTVWVIGWVGVAFLSLCFGHVWRWLNPWDSLFALGEKVFRARRNGPAPGRPLPYPAWLDVWPAFLLFVIF